MSPAQGGEVAVAGGAAGGVGDDVVGVAAAGGAAAPGEHAGRVEQGDPGAEPVADLVAVHAGVVVQVDDGHHGEVGVGASAPVADLLLEDRPAGGLVAPDQLGAPRTASMLRCTNRVVRRRGFGAARRASRAAAASGSASTPTARERRTSRESGLPVGGGVLLGQPGRDLGEGPVEVGEVLPVGADASSSPIPVAVTDSSWRVACRASRASQAGQLDLLGVEPHHRLVDQPVQGDRADLLRDRRDRLVELGGDIVGLARPPLGRSAAPATPAPPGPAPGSHTRGSRCRSTSASRIIASPARGGDAQRRRERRPRVPRHRRHVRVRRVGIADPAQIQVRGAHGAGPRRSRRRPRGPGARRPTPSPAPSARPPGPAPPPPSRAPARSGRSGWCAARLHDALSLSNTCSNSKTSTRPVNDAFLRRPSHDHCFSRHRQGVGAGRGHEPLGHPVLDVMEPFAERAIVELDGCPQ